MMYTKKPKSILAAKRYLYLIYKRYPEYHDDGFDKMVERFAANDFYKAHIVAKFYLEKTTDFNRMGNVSIKGCY